MDPTTIGTWIGVLVAIGGVIAGAVQFAFWVFDEIRRRKDDIEADASWVGRTSIPHPRKNRRSSRGQVV